MGADGGTIPTRDEMVKVKRKQVKEDPSIKFAAKWKHCAVSSEPLRPPIVACELGQLFNKEDLMRTLLSVKDGSIERPPELKHVKKLKDVHELNLKPVTSSSSSSSSTQLRGDEADVEALFECPITGVPTNGRHRFVYPVTCGCVVSERALREIPTSACLVCSKPFTEEDLVVLCVEQDEMKEMAAKMKARKERAKAAKKVAKATGKATAAAAAASAFAGTTSPSSSSASAVPANGVRDEDMARFRKEAEVIKRRAQHAGEQKKKHPKMQGQSSSTDLQSDALKWALSSKSVADKPDASNTLKKLFHSGSKKDMNEYKTFTSRSGYSLSHTWG